MAILNTTVEKGILETLVQFYDPLYHCFTFPDYQLLPTLEEYSYLMGLPVLKKVPFTGLEKIHEPPVIAKALHLETSVVKANFIEKKMPNGVIKGIESKFLLEKAHYYAKANSTGPVEAILSLLIYGLVLFQNINDFVDVNAIRIFLSGNPVPTLLGDSYLSIHHRIKKEGGVISCCAPLLYRWFISHLPKSRNFQDNPEKLIWSKRIMSLTHVDINWYNSAYDKKMIIDGCGEFSNVPLLGIKGGVSYNPALC